ncbi:MAG: hypothetical protein WA830_20165 [Candidatus Sulfotelmatobacter sp.]
MRSRFFLYSAAVALLAALALSLAVAAQESTTENHKAKHHHYKLVVIEALGGPNSFFTDFPGNTIGMLNHRGSVTGVADTSMLDPYAPNFPWYDGYLAHAFQRRNGVMKDLGALPDGGNSSSSTWISANGLIAGVSENGLIDPLYAGMPEVRAVIWKNGKIQDLGTLEGGYESAAYAINSHGQVVGTSTNTVPDANSMAPNTWWLWGYGIATYQYQTRAFLWDNENGMQDLGTLGTGADAQALFINEAGQVAGVSYVSSASGAGCGFGRVTDSFIWDKESGMRDLGSFGGSCTKVADLNNRGQVVGAAWVVGDQAIRPFLWDKGSFRDLGGTLGGTQTNALALNQRGEAAGTASLPGDNTTHAVLWRHVGEFTDLGTVGNDPCAFAWAINDATQVVGLSSPSDCANYNVSRPFLWEKGSMVDLNSLIPPNSPLTLIYAYAINDRGEIPGNGADASGNVQAFVLIPCDENHPGVEGCDYSLADVTAPAANSSQSITAPHATTMNMGLTRLGAGHHGARQEIIRQHQSPNLASSNH